VDRLKALKALSRPKKHQKLRYNLIVISLKTIKKVARWLLVTLVFQSFVVSGSLAAVDAALSKDPSFKIPVCSISGLKWVEVKSAHQGQTALAFTDTNSNHDSTPSDHSNHCSMCSALAAVPVKAVDQNPDWIKFQSFYPDFEEQPQHRVKACLPPPSQAPPQFS
jgi:hypothetical protein